METLNKLFEFRMETALASTAGTITGLSLSDLNTTLSNIVLILNGTFILIGILKNIPLKSLLKALDKTYQKPSENDNKKDQQS